MTPEQALLAAMQHAANVAIRVAGVTRDHYVVTTAECVEYQKKQGTLLYEMNGNWQPFKRGNYSGVKKGETIITTYPLIQSKSNGKRNTRRRSSRMPRVSV